MGDKPSRWSQPAVGHPALLIQWGLLNPNDLTKAVSVIGDIRSPPGRILAAMNR